MSHQTKILCDCWLVVSKCTYPSDASLRVGLMARDELLLGVRHRDLDVRRAAVQTGAQVVDVNVGVLDQDRGVLGN